jgi:hypothetical protein
VSAFLPYGRQTIDDDDVAAVAQALRDEMGEIGFNYRLGGGA